MSQPYSDDTANLNHNVQEPNQDDLSSSTNIKSVLNPTIFLCLGFIIWFVATLVIRFFGHYIFQPNQPLLALALYLVSSFGILILALSIFTWQNLHPSQQFQATILLALPGMFLDSIVMVSFRAIFPSLAPSSDSAVASWLLWCYAFVLIAAFMQREKTINREVS